MTLIVLGGGGKILHTKQNEMCPCSPNDNTAFKQIFLIDTALVMMENLKFQCKIKHI